MATLLLDETRLEGDHIYTVIAWRIPESEAHPEGIKYRFHYGTVDGETILRYDNSHGVHERHTRRASRSSSSPVSSSTIAASGWRSNDCDRRYGGMAVSKPSRLTVRVEPAGDFHDRVERRLESIGSGANPSGTATLSLPDDATLSRVFDETTLTLLRAIATHGPTSMRETARLVGRDVKDVSRQLHELNEIGIIDIEDSGRSKRPVVPYDEISVRVAVRDDDAIETQA